MVETPIEALRRCQPIILDERNRLLPAIQEALVRGNFGIARQQATVLASSVKDLQRCLREASRR